MLLSSSSNRGEGYNKWGVNIDMKTIILYTYIQKSVNVGFNIWMDVRNMGTRICSF